MSISPTKTVHLFEPQASYVVHDNQTSYSFENVVVTKDQIEKNAPLHEPRTVVEVNHGFVECRNENVSFQLSPITRIESNTASINILEEENDEQLTGIFPLPKAYDHVVTITRDCSHKNSSFLEHDKGGEFEINNSESVEERETDQERLQRELEESEALARQLMAEEAMASYAMSTEFLRENADRFSSEDLAALQAALAEEEPETTDEEELDRDNSEDLSYDGLLRLGERIGDVKEERWALIAHEKIKNIPTLLFEPALAKGMDENHTEVKCLICLFPYEECDELRRLPCHHCFHKDCVDSWLQTKDTCALCRKSIVP